MDDLEINDYLRRALQSADGQFSEISASHPDETESEQGTFLTNRPLTPRQESKSRPTTKNRTTPNEEVDKTELALNKIKWKKASLLATQAFELMECGNYYDANIKLNKAIQMRGDIEEFYVCRAECLLQFCDFKSAILNYNYALSITDKEIGGEWKKRLAFIHYLHSQLLFDEHDYGGALEQVETALKLFPGTFSYQCRKISYLYELKQHKRCFEELQVLFDEHEITAELYVLRARLNRLYGSTTKCFYDVHKALEIDPDNEQAYQICEELERSAEQCKNAAVNYALNGNIMGAVNKINISIETNPTQAEYNIFRGTLYRQLGKYNEAIDDFMITINKINNNEALPLYQSTLRQLVLSYNDFAIECYLKGYFEEAISLLDQAIKRERDEKGFYLNRGDCFKAIGYLSFALADYQQALELDPRDWVIISRISLVHHQYGINEYREKRFIEAEKCFTTAITCNIKVAQYYISRSWSRFMQKNLPGARADLLRGIYLDPDMEEGIMLSARLYPNENIDSILAAKSSQKILKQMKELVVSEQLDHDEVVVSHNTLTYEPIGKENMAQFTEWINSYKKSNNKVKTILDERPDLTFPVPRVISVEKVRTALASDSKSRVRSKLRTEAK